MDAKQKMAVTGVGMMAAGIGLGIAGAALIAPAVFAWTAGLVEKTTDHLGNRLENASRTVGTVAGNLRRSFREAGR